MAGKVQKAAAATIKVFFMIRPRALVGIIREWLETSCLHCGRICGLHARYDWLACGKVQTNCVMGKLVLGFFGKIGRNCKTAAISPWKSTEMRKSGPGPRQAPFSAVENASIQGIRSMPQSSLAVVRPPAPQPRPV
jgi:hypothetical protein